MAIEIGVGYLSILPETSKIAPGVRQVLGQTEGDAERSGRRAGRRFGKSFSSGLDGLKGPALAVAGAIGGIVTSSVNLEKKFSQTMNVAAATMGAPQKEMQKLQTLALDLGAATSFSANEAADAMLELAKGGLSPATIQAGALEGTLTLAAAGGTSLATAAGIASNALNTFNIEGKDMAVVAAALSGGANASTASVESLGQALAQVGPGAVNAGLDIHETIGALAAFDNAGIKGSDAGTSLKTMLQRLVPQTERAAKAMRQAGLDFIDAEGNFVSLDNMAQQLKDSLGGLTESERTTALNDIFGSDASRAASVLMTEGAEGIRNYISATKDQGAAEDAAQARMAGTAGALERLSGAWETLRLKIGIGVAPLVVTLADGLGKVADFLGEHLDIIGPVAAGLGVMAGAILAITAAQWAWNLAMTANPIGLIIVGVAGLIAGLALFFTKTETGQKIVKTVWGGIKTAIGAVVDWFQGTAWPGIKAAWDGIVDAFQTAWRWIKSVWDGIVTAAKVAWTILKVVFVAIATGFALAWKVVTAIWKVTGKPLFDVIVQVAKWLGERIATTWANIRHAIGVAWNWINRNVIIPFRIGVAVLGAVFRTLWQTYVVPAWNGIKSAISTAWNWIKAHIFTPLADGIKVIGRFFRELWMRYVLPAWGGIKSAARDAWGWIRDKVFSPLKRGVSAIGDAFKKVKDVIKTAWDKIKSAAAKPVNFIIETVYTKGIKKTWDDIADAVGLDLKLPTISPLKYASGGVLPGYTPGRDVHHFTSPTGGRLSLSGGEAIMRPEFTRAVGGPAGVARLNAMARKGQAFKNGGVFGDAWEKIKDVGSSFLSGPAGFIKKVISGPMGELLRNIGGGTLGKIAGQLPRKVVDALIGKAKDMASSLFGGDQALAGGGKPAGPALGWQAMWNVVKSAFPGASLNSAFRPGAITAVGTPSYHGQGRAIDVTPSMSIFNWIAKHFPNSRELIYSPAGRRQLWNGRQYMFGEPTRGDHWDHVHWAMANGGVWSGLFDQGGWLPNKGVGLNLTGQPEAVLTPAESKALKAGVISSVAEAKRYVRDDANARSGRQRVTLQVGRREFEAYLTEIAEDVVDADARFNGTTRRMQ